MRFEDNILRTFANEDKPQVMQACFITNTNVVFNAVSFATLTDCNIWLSPSQNLNIKVILVTNRYDRER